MQTAIGNVAPVLLCSGTLDEVRAAVRNVFDNFAHYSTFIISTGCDITAAAKWENIDACFESD